MFNSGEWCLKNKQTAIALFFLAFIIGLISFFTIPRLALPEYELTVATVITPFPGASPARVEQLVTIPLQNALRDIPEIEFIKSQSISNVSILQVSLWDKYRKNIREIWPKVRNKIADARSSLPKEAFAPIFNDEFGDVYGILLALTGDDVSYNRLSDIAMKFRNDLFKIPNVAKVTVFGQQEEKIFVEFSNARLSQFGFTPFAIADILNNQNTISASGSTTLDGELITMETTGEFTSVDAIKQAVIQIPGRTERIHLGDLTTIRRGYVDPPSPMARFNGQKGLVIGINVQKGGNMIEMGDNVLKLVDTYNATFSEGLKLNILSYQPESIKSTIELFMHNLTDAIVFVVVIMMLLAGWRTGVITGLLIPMSLLTCITFLPLFHVNLEQISIAAMIIALGVLVDNGVVVSESMLVRLSSGVSRETAVKDAVSQLWLPLLSASLCTIFAFMPIPLSKAPAGDMTYSLFVVMALSLMFSWIFSMTFVPFLCYYMLKPKLEKQDYHSFFYRHYRNLLLRCLKYRYLFVPFMAGLLIFTIWGFKFVPKSFFPPNEQPLFMLDLWTPVGTDISKTSAIASNVEAFLLQQEEVTSVGSFIGDGGPRWQLSVPPGTKASNYSFMIINTRDKNDVAVMFDKTNRYLEKQFPDIRYLMKKIPYGPVADAPLSIQITGPNIQELYIAKDLVEKEMKQTKGLINIRDDWGDWVKKLIVNVQQRGAKLAGLSSNDIALSLQTLTSGYEPTVYREGDHMIPIVLRTKEEFRNDIGDLEGLNVYSLRDQRNVPLSEVAKLNLVWQPSVINRFNNEREIMMGAEVSGRTLDEVVHELMPKLDALKTSASWPKGGYGITLKGEFAESENSKNSILEGVPISFSLLIFTLIAQFNSFRNVLIILCTLPLIMIGITPGLLITNAQFGFLALLGLISLNGIVVNHAIMMLDQMNIELEMGHKIDDAIVISAQRRLRPIMATALVTSVGLIPLSFYGGEMWRPMSNTIIFGVLFSTVLTLLLCPVLYSIFYRVNFRNYIWRHELMLEEKI